MSGDSKRRPRNPRHCSDQEIEERWDADFNEFKTRVRKNIKAFLKGKKPKIQGPTEEK